MSNESQGRKWYQLTIRDKFMLTGMLLGISSYGFLQRHFQPEPSFLWLLTPILMLAGAAIGEVVKRRRLKNA
jgi:hypothetical protein